MPELIGRTLGQYRIIEQIGQGGMATVYKAYQPGLDRDVALKILPPLHAKQPGFSERFRREAKAIANLHHPNILPVYDSGRDGDYSYLVMRYIDGARTLADVMRGRLTLEQVSNLIGQIASALSYAHRQGVIHRDVKPGNVLMDGDWVLLTDFGLAKMTEASVKLTGTGVGMGTPAYMSPEQGQGKPIDHRTDIYALGVILYEMLTGQIPHNAETPVAIIFKRISEPLPLPHTLNPAVTEPVERVILKALTPNPADRFGDAEAMAAALHAAIAKPQSVDEQPTRFSPPLSDDRPPPVVTQTDDFFAPPPPASRWQWGIAAGAFAIVAIIGAGILGAGVWLFSPSKTEMTDTEVSVSATIAITPAAESDNIPTPQPIAAKTAAPAPPHTPVLPTATPRPVASATITAANAPRITEMQRVGRGTIEDIALIIQVHTAKSGPPRTPAATAPARRYPADCRRWCSAHPV